MKRLLHVAILLCTLYLPASAQIQFTRIVINSGRGSSDPQDFCIYHDKIYFSARTDSTGRELWVTDGSQDGTRMVKDIIPGGYSSWPHDLDVINDRIVFYAQTIHAQNQLWVSDGTEQGTFKLKDVDSANGQVSLAPSSNFVTFHNRVIFMAAQNPLKGLKGLWVSDGTFAGTYPIDTNAGFYSNDITGGIRFIQYHDRVYFVCRDSSYQSHMWETDGTSAGTKPVTILETDSYKEVALAIDKMFFKAWDSTHGFEPWISDGTAAGTYMLKDLDPGPNVWQYFPNPVDFAGKAYFIARDDSGDALFSTDGTNSGTKLIYRSSCYTPVNAIFKNHLFMWSGPGIDNHLIAIDSETGQTNIVKDTLGINTPVASLAVYNNTLYIFATIDTFDVAIYALKDANAKPVLVKRSTMHNVNVGQIETILYRNAIWFGIHFDDEGTELWKIEDTTTIPHQPFAIYPNPNHGSFTIHTGDENFTGNVYICNIAGQVIYNKQIEGLDIPLQIPTALPGIYFAKLKSNNGISSYKIVVW